MRKFVVLAVCMSLSTPAFAETPAGPPEKVANPPKKVANPQDAVDHSPATQPASTAKAPPTAVAAAGGKKKLPSAADRKKWPAAVQKAWDSKNVTVQNAIVNRLNAGGDLKDPKFQETLATLVADAKGEKPAAVPAAKPAKKASAAQSAALAPPTVPSSTADAPLPAVAAQPAHRDRDKNIDKNEKDTEAEAVCTTGECNGTQPAEPLTRGQREVVEQFAEPPPERPVREQSSGFDFDWKSGLLGGALGFAGGYLLSNFLNKRNNNNNNRYCGFGPGGQGQPWWNYPQGNRGNGLPDYYRAPGSAYGVGGFGGGYPQPINSGYNYGGGFGVGAQGFPPPATLPYPGPTQTAYNTFQSNGANIYNGGFNSLGVQPNIFGNPNMSVPNIVQGR